MANRGGNNLMQQINALEISAMDDVSACDSTFDNPYRSQVVQHRPRAQDSTLNRSSANRQSFMNFGTQGGKRSPINRAHINRMTQNLVANHKSYLNRRSTMMEPVKQPIPLREMWRAQQDEHNADDDDDLDELGGPTGASKAKKDKSWFKTTVKFEKDMEVFETEELGSDEEEQDDDLISSDSQLSGDEARERSDRKKKPAAKPKDNPVEPVSTEPVVPDYGNLRKGVDIIDDEISTERAYTVFRELERDQAARQFKPPALLAETGGAATQLSRFSTEIPSLRISRLQKELESLQQELVDLEKEEIPSRMKKQTQTAKQSLRQIDELRSYMHKVVTSSQFKDLETRQNLDLTKVLNKAYRHLADQEAAAAQQESGAKKAGAAGNPQELKHALQMLLSSNVAKLDSSEIVKGAQVQNEIELFVKVDCSPDELQKFKSELQLEQHKRYLALQTDLDECERVVGPWNPVNKFSSIYDALDNVHDEIDEFNINEEAKVAPTPTNTTVPATPGGSRRSTISAKAKQFNADLYTLQQKFQSMEDVAYDQQKVDMVFGMTERALEQKQHLQIVLERLNVLENIHKESPNLEARMKSIVQKAAKEIPAALLRETEESTAARKQIIEAAAELDQLV